MRTDVVDFDGYLKQGAYRDLLFRVLTWLGIALAAASVASLAAMHGLARMPVVCLERLGKRLAHLANAIGPFGLLVCLLACLAAASVAILVLLDRAF